VLAVNPPAASLGKENAVLSGSGTRYYVPDFEGCLSVKTVVSGTAVWETENRRFAVNEDSWLILNDRQRYTITIDSLRPVTTFCLFFERGFVEEIYRAQVTPASGLVDWPQPFQSDRLDFFTRIESGVDSLLLTVSRQFQAELSSGTMSRLQWDERFMRMAETLVLGRTDALRARQRLPALRKGTREEIYRRLLKGRDFLLSSISERIALKDMAEAACLSPFHFHRSFKRVFGETPHRYLTRHRLEHAARLLSRTDLTVTEICFSSGFESLTSFGGLFRRHFGVSPGKFSKIKEAQASTPL
jgi:AraC-like DNA-binding protein